MSYMCMPCFFKFLGHVNLCINSLTFETEKLLKTLIQTVKFALKSDDLCRLLHGVQVTVLKDKPQLQFDTKPLSKKVGLVPGCLRYYEINRK